LQYTKSIIFSKFINFSLILSAYQLNAKFIKNETKTAFYQIQRWRLD